MRYVLGIEGGQATTTAVITDETGCVLGIGQGSSMRPGLETGDGARAQKALGDAVQAAIRMADLENARIAAACIHAAAPAFAYNPVPNSFGRPNAADTDSAPNQLRQNNARRVKVLEPDLLQAACENVLPDSRLLFETGPRVALYAVTFGRPGVVVCAGIGAVAYGRNERGEQAQSGGWGRVLGDEGSGYWIGRGALAACCRAQDGIEAPTQLEPLLLKHLEMPDLNCAREAIACNALTPADIAALSEIVSRAAAQGDKAARRILREAGKELALSAQATLRRLNMEQEPVVVGTMGGVFRAGRAVLRAFRETVKQAAPNATIVPARVPPCVGAALIALEAIDVPLREELFANLETHLPRLAAVKA